MKRNRYAQWAVLLLLFFVAAAKPASALTISNDTTWSGNITVLQDVIITDSSTLTISAGSILNMGYGISVKGGPNCHILVQGSAANKVIIRSSVPGTYWGALNVKGVGASVEVYFADIQSGQVLAYDTSTMIIQDSYLHDYLKMPTKNISYASNATFVTLERCHISNYYQVNYYKTPVLIENCLFEYIAEDGIDMDNSPSAIIRNCTFRNGLCEKGKIHSVDAIDFGKFDIDAPGSIGDVSNCLVYNITDKGVSAGEKCRHITVTNSVFYNCGSGATIKDSSLAEIVNNTIINCEFGIECVEKNPGYGAGHASGYNNILWNNGTTVFLDNDGTLSLSYSDISFNGVFPGTGNINSYPMFLDSANLSFQLLPGSPCLGTGSVGTDMGAFYPVGGITNSTDYLMIGIPHSSEVINGDSLYSINWTAEDSIHFVNLDFSSDNGNSWTSIAQNLNAQPGYYLWTIPNIYSSKCFIRVTDVANGANTSMQNLPFSITPVGGTSSLPAFSLPAGYYSNSIDLSLSSDTVTTIFYTLDGSEPTDQSPQYVQPINLRQQFISAANPEQNMSASQDPHFPISFIRTAPIVQIGPTYCFWTKPTGTTDMISVVKARCYKPGLGLGDVVTNTYLIDSTGTLNPSRLPVISMTTDKKNLFDYYSGTYIPGAAFTGYSWTGNYEMSGKESEREINFEYFDSAGARIFSLPSGIRPRGEWIRGYGQKALSLFARSEYDTINYFNYKFFPGYQRDAIGGEMSSFKRLIIRNSGNEWISPENTMLKDGALQSLLDHLHLKYQAEQQAIMFLNGEYWGIHNIRELPDQYSIALTYSIDKDAVAIMEHNPWELNHLKTGTENDKNDFLAFRDYLVNTNLNNNGVWEYINTKIDVENFTDFWISTIYSERTTADHNTGWWKYSGHGYDPYAPYGKDGRWRWFVYDYDDAFKHPSMDMMQQFGQNVYQDWLFYPLVTCDKYKGVFITRYCDLLNSTFKPTRVEERLLEKKAEIAAEINRHSHRWGTPISVTNWSNGVDSLIDFGYVRPAYAYNELKNYFGLQATANLTVNVNDKTKGKIKVNTILIDGDLPGVDSLIYPWIGAYFKNFPTTLVAIAEPGYKFVRWIETGTSFDSISVLMNGDLTFTALFDVDPDYQPTVYLPLFINEVCASNNSVIDNYGGTPDWFEIYNPNNTVVDLAGWCVSDDFNYLNKHRFAANDTTKIPANGFLLLFADGETDQGCNHVSFNLNAGGDEIYLTTPDAHTIIDSLSYGFQVSDTSWGRYPDGSPDWEFFSFTTPGASNIHISVPEITGTATLKIYPNPLADGLLYFSEAVSFHLCNEMGQEIMYVKNKKEVNLSSLNKGIYFIHTDQGIAARLVKLN